MGAYYSQISIEERCELARLLAKGTSYGKIATALGRAPSTIMREVERNGSSREGYQARYAQEQAEARRWRGMRLERDGVLRETVLTYLQQDWSPEQVAGRLAQQAGAPVISHESIYRFIYGQIARTKNYAWRRFLPQGRTARRRHRRNRRSPASFMAQRRPLAERPAAAADRQTPGHWEADLMLFGRSGHAVLTLHERHSRLLLATRTNGKAAEPIASAMRDLLTLVPPDWRQTVTFDNGTEFARHYRLHDLGIQTFFCDTHAPWQKGGIENAIGRLRRALPRKTDLATVTAERFAQLVKAYNHTPRKCLDFQTPAEVFLKQVLHLKCESTFPLSRE